MFDLMPFENRKNYMSNFSNFFNEFEKNLFGDLAQSFNGFKTDIVDKGDHYLLDAELPGFAKEDINIDIADDRLTISAQHKSENEEKKDNFIRKERTFGAYTRSFDISNIKANEISASYKNGILELKLPKLEDKTPPSRKIEIQ